MKALRLSYKRVEAGQTVASELAYLPITVSTGNGSVELQGLLDSGSTVNVLPYTVGLALGFFLGTADDSSSTHRELIQNTSLWGDRDGESWLISTCRVGLCLDAGDECAINSGASQFFHGI